jgi:nucleoside-diphosphate-sugar epimerase
VLKVLVLGASGYVGSHLMQALQSSGWALPTGASRNRPANSIAAESWIQLNTLDQNELVNVLRRFDAVVNCVAGDATSIRSGARALVTAATHTKLQRIVHMSSMAVYGSLEGAAHEASPLLHDLGWYAQAKYEAELELASFAGAGGNVVILRPGCVFGVGSELWVGRIGRWLKSGRLGDLGVAGDGWSNLVHVDDVCDAILAALRLPQASPNSAAFNLSAPDSPRWNDYFIDLALAIGATPVKRLTGAQLKLDAWGAGPPLKIVEKLLRNKPELLRRLPDPLPPGVLKLWSQHIQLDSTKAKQDLGFKWTPYAVSLTESASWFKQSPGADNIQRIVQPENMSKVG